MDQGTYCQRFLLPPQKNTLHFNFPEFLERTIINANPSTQ